MPKQDDNMSASEAAQEYVIVGRLGSSYGVRGWSKIQSFTDPMDNILAYDKLYFQIKGQWQHIKILDARPHNGTLVAHLDNCHTPEAAKCYTGCDIAVTVDQLPAAEEGEYYWKDLQGCQVYNVDGVHFGEVSYVTNTGASDMLIVVGDKERLIPFITDNFVKEVDISAKKIVVDWDAEF